MTLVEINGIDEGGRVGEIIFFVRLGVPLPYENRLMLHNLSHFDKLLIQHNDLKGFDKTNLLKYVKEISDDKAFQLSVFLMREELQLRLLRELHRFECAELFRVRGDLLRAYKGEPDKLSAAIEALDAYQHESIYIESLVKGFGMMEITRKLPDISRLYSIQSDQDRLLVVQVDGGYPFVSWWKDLVAEQSFPLAKEKVFFAGITSGDTYYPVLSSAGAIASIFSREPPSIQFYPVSELCPREQSLLSENFYRRHKTSLTRPTFQYRLLFIGNIGQESKTLIPFVQHRKERTKTYEPFTIEKNAENFIRFYGEGSPENTIIVYGTLRDETEKRNLKYFEEKGYLCKHICDIKGEFELFFKELEEEIDVLPSERRSALSAKLQQLKIKCEDQLK